jgi:hypothetical protein
VATKNYLLNSDFTRGLNSWVRWAGGSAVVIDDTEVAGFSKAIQITVNSQNNGYTQSLGTLPAGTYTASGWMKSDIAGKDYLQIATTDLTTGVTSYPKTSFTTTTMTQMSVSFTLSHNATVSIQLGRGGGDATTVTTFTATGIQIEPGNAVTSWVAGTEPNMIQNSGFLDGMTHWNLNTSTVGQIVDDLDSPTTKAYHVIATGGGQGIWENYSDVAPTIGKTYTMSIVAKGTAGISYGWEGLSKVQTLTDQYQHISYTFTYSQNNNFRVYTNSAGDLYVHSVKVEEGPYATDYIASQADINKGKDRIVLAVGQKTIIDYNDKVSLVSRIASNNPLTQQYYPSTETFSPDWTVTNTVLTASLFKGSDTADIISTGDVRTITWYKLSILDGANPVQISTNGQYSVNGKTLTITQNVLNDKDSIDYICEIVYRDPVTQQDLLTRASIIFNRVRNGGALTQAYAWLPNGGVIKNNKALSYQANDNHMGRNLERYTDYISAGATGWSSAGPTGYTAVTRTVVNEPTAPTGKAMQITWPETLTSTAGPHKPPISVLTAGVTYSWSVWVKASRAIASMAIGQEQGGQKTVALTTSWQKITNTFVATTSTYYSFVFYQIPTAGDQIWVHSLKLEEGPNPTDWSMAPEDIVTIDEAVGDNSWVVNKYMPPSRNGAFVPTYNDIASQRVAYNSRITDSSSLIIDTVGTLANPYVGHLQTAIYSDKDRGLPISFQNNNPLTIYANNQQMYQDTSAVRNYYKAANFSPMSSITASFDAVNKVWSLTIPANDTSTWRGISYNQRNAVLRSGRVYTISFEAYADIAIPLGMDVNNFGLVTATGVNDNDIVASRITRAATTVPGQWTRFSTTITMPANLTQDFYDNADLGIANGWTSPATPTILKIRNMMFEESATPSTYVPAPEDTIKTTSLALKQGWNTIDILYYATPYDQNGMYNMWVGNRNIFPTTQMTNVTKISPGTIKAQSWANTVMSNSQIKTYFKPSTTYTITAKYTLIQGSNLPQYDMNVGFNFYSPATGSILFGTTHSLLQHGDVVNISSTFTTPADFADKTLLLYTSRYADATTAEVGIVQMENLKIEEGSNDTPWSISTSDSSSPDPNTISLTMDVNTFYSLSFRDYISNIIAKIQLMRGSTIDTTNVQYQWYKQDGTIITDQGGGIGWLKLGSSSIEQGYNLDTLIIPPNAVPTVGYYKCIIRDTQVDSVTYNGYFSSIVTVANVEMPIDIRVEAVGGKVILNGQVNKSLLARLFQDGREIDTSGSAYIYKWYRYLADGTKDTAWQNSIGYKTGKIINITNADVTGKATFGVEIS